MNAKNKTLPFLAAVGLLAMTAITSLAAGSGGRRPPQPPTPPEQLYPNVADPADVTTALSLLLPENSFSGVLKGRGEKCTVSVEPLFDDAGRLSMLTPTSTLTVDYNQGMHIYNWSKPDGLQPVKPTDSLDLEAYYPNGMGRYPGTFKSFVINLKNGVIASIFFDDPDATGALNRLECFASAQ